MQDLIPGGPPAGDSIALQDIGRNRDLVRRIFVTLGIVVLSRLMALIPLPGIDMDAVYRQFRVPESSWIERVLWDRLTLSLSVVGLGVTPFITACIAVQLASAVVPSVRRWFARDTEESRMKIVRVTWWAALPVAVLWAWNTAGWVGRFAVPGMAEVPDPGWMFRVRVVVCITAGTYILLWLARVIQRHGIGSGVAILAVAGPALGTAYSIYATVGELAGTNIARERIAALVGTYIGIVVGAAILFWLMTKATRKVPARFGDSGVLHEIRLRFSWLGQAPLVSVELVFSLMTIVFMRTTGIHSRALQDLLARGGWSHTAVYLLLFVPVTFFYIYVIFNPSRVRRMGRRYGCEIGLLDRPLKRMTVPALVVIAVLWLCHCFRPLAQTLQYAASGGRGSGPYLPIMDWLSLLMIAGVAYDLRCQIQARLRLKRKAGRAIWKVGYTAFDEIEAEIKKGYLATKGIECVIEPLRFSWGLPIRTAVDEYRLHVPAVQAAQVRELLAAGAEGQSRVRAPGGMP